MELLEVLIILILAGVANMTPVFIKRLKFLNIPLDLGKKWNSKEILGKGKTLRGTFFGSISGILTAAFLFSIFQNQILFFRILGVFDSLQNLILNFFEGVFGDVLPQIFSINSFSQSVSDPDTSLNISAILHPSIINPDFLDQNPVLYNFSTDFFYAVSLGFLIALFSTLGDLFKSFVKRRVGIESGKTWLIFDQLDWIFGVLLILTLLRLFHFSHLFLIPLGLLTHLTFKFFGNMFKIDSKPI